jgi:EmrB/QacA subfamily drug resistance transporter
MSADSTTASVTTTTDPGMTAPSAQPWGLTLSRKRIILVVVSLILGMLLAALDQTIVGTALPHIVADLNGLQHYAWVATGYLLASTASMPIWGKLSDAYGRKRFFIIGMIIFVAGSALSGQSHSMNELIAFRTVQGLGAGAIMPLVQAILGDIFPPARMARWMGVLMSTFAVATIIGPLLGGWITDNIGWRWVFYVNLPVGIVALVFAAFALPGHTSLRRHVIDYSGTALLVAAAVPLLLALSWAGSTYPWVSWQVIGSLVFSGVMWVAFAAREQRAAEPIINPGLFGNSIFTISATASALQSAGMFGAIMFLPLFVQGVLGKTATNSGIVLMPLMIGAIVTSIGAGQILARTGRYKVVVIVGFIVAVVGMFLLSRMGIATSQGTLALDMVVLGLGLGVSMSVFTVIVQNQYPTQRLGEVTAGLQFFRSIGSTVGLAVFGSLLNSRFSSALFAGLPAPLKALDRGPAAQTFGNPQVLLSAGARERLGTQFSRFGPQSHSLFDAFMSAVRHALSTSITSLFVLGVVLMVAGLVVVLFLKEVPLRRTFTVTQSESTEEASDAAAPGVAEALPASVDRGASPGAV